MDKEKNMMKKDFYYIRVNSNIIRDMERELCITNRVELSNKVNGKMEGLLSECMIYL